MPALVIWGVIFNADRSIVMLDCHKVLNEHYRRMACVQQCLQLCFQKCKPRINSCSHVSESVFDRVCCRLFFFPIEPDTRLYVRKSAEKTGGILTINQLKLDCSLFVSLNYTFSGTYYVHKAILKFIDQKGSSGRSISNQVDPDLIYRSV